MNIDINKFFDKIYIITTLFAPPERTENVNKLLNICSNVQLITALNFSCITEDFMPTVNKHFGNGDINNTKRFLVNQMSCSTSHYNCILHAYLNNYKRILILEDDSFINVEVWNDKDFIIPENIDIIKLYPLRGIDDNERNIKINESFLIDPDWLSPRASAYILTPKSIRMLKEIYETEYNMADLPLFFLNKNCKKYGLTYAYCCKHFIIDNEQFRSTIIENHIQK